MNYIQNAKGGPAPLFPNPAKFASGATGVLKAVCLIVSIVGVIVNKAIGETCVANLVGFMAINCLVCLAFSILFLHVAMQRFASDREWLIVNMIFILFSISEAMVCAWGVTLCVLSSASLGVSQCFDCLDTTGATVASTAVCASTYSCLESSRLTIYSETACPGWGSSSGNTSIECELLFLCSNEGPYTYAMGITVVAVTLAVALWSNYLIYCHFLVSLVTRLLSLTK